jgi:hypothetical protein
MALPAVKRARRHSKWEKILAEGIKTLRRDSPSTNNKKGEKCRFLPISPESKEYQGDALFSAVPTYREQAQNALRTCKTKRADQPKENAASIGVDHGVKVFEKTGHSQEKPTLKTQANAMSNWASDSHKRVATAISFALTLSTSKAWEGLSLILMARLTKAERAALAYSALLSLDDDLAYRTASVALFGVLNGEVAQ